MHTPIAVAHAPTFYIHASIGACSYILQLAHALTFFMHATITMASEFIFILKNYYINKYFKIVIILELFLKKMII